MIKSADYEKSSVHDEEKHEKTKGKKKLGKTHDEQIQAESNVPASLSINSTVDEKEKEKENHNYNTKENSQTNRNDTVIQSQIPIIMMN